MKSRAPEPRAEANGPLPIGAREVAASFCVLAIFILTQFLAVVLIGPFKASGVKGFEDPEAPENGLWLLLIVVIFTLAILYIVKKRMMRVVQGLILGSVGLTLVYVIFPLLDLIPHAAFDPGYVPALGAWNLAAVLAFPPAILLTWLLVTYPEWYIVDAVGVGVSAGAIAIFGGSFTAVTYLFVLVAFAVYDYVSVYRTKHMLSLADTVLDLHLPIMFIVPKHLEYSFLDEHGKARAIASGKAKKKPRDAMFIGLGDVVIPSIFAITALPLSWVAALGTFAGIGIGLMVLLAFVLRGRPHAGLPLLNTGAFLGFLAGLYIGTGSVVFW